MRDQTDSVTGLGRGLSGALNLDRVRPQDPRVVDAHVTREPRAFNVEDGVAGAVLEGILGAQAWRLVDGVLRGPLREEQAPRSSHW